MSPRIVILTGAGISAESGLGTFRDSGGLWEKYPIEQVATPEAFARDPALVQKFYNIRRRDALNAKPNAAHEALAKLEKHLGSQVMIVTQNVDDLHERAGSRNVLHMHGELMQVRCTSCGARHQWVDDVQIETTCPACYTAHLRPDIVWFGEYPYHMEEIWDALRHADLFVSIGTSGNVYPAAAFVQDASRAGAQTLELNLEPSQGVSDFDEVRHGPATQIVPDWVAEQLSKM